VRKSIDEEGQCAGSEMYSTNDPFRNLDYAFWDHEISIKITSIF
jgi:hypothetical protein